MLLLFKKKKIAPHSAIQLGVLMQLDLYSKGIPKEAQFGPTQYMFGIPRAVHGVS
jgi:hypothetical protein